MDHLIILPVVLPLVVASAMLLINERRHRLKAGLSLGTTALLAVVGLTLLHQAATGGEGGADTARVYALGDWAAPYGIVLVADRLSSMMLALSSVLGLGALIFALARWDRAGPRFHALFLLLLMGVNGAFLTGDLFNLFVFFEVMLAASYGLLLHGSGTERIRAALGYIAINLTASLFFLVGVALIYGSTGTLNMADLAMRIPMLPAEDRPLFEIGAAILSIAFLVKAAAWPLGFWLPGAYAAASAPVAAAFAILSKVGVYVVIRLHLLLFGPNAGDSAGFGLDWLLWSGIATIVFGTALLLASRKLVRAAGAAVMISSGTMIAIVGTGDGQALAGAVFYLAGSTLAAGALYLVAEMLSRGRADAESDEAPVFEDEYQDPLDSAEQEIGLVIPATTAVIGGFFLVCTLILAGVPPLAGFIGKLAVFDGLLQDAGAQSWRTGLMIGVLTLSSFGVLIGLVRFGMDALWVPADETPPAVRAPEFVAVAGLLAACLALTIWGEAAFAYAQHTAEWLVRPDAYVVNVLGRVQ